MYLKIISNTVRTNTPTSIMSSVEMTKKKRKNADPESSDSDDSDSDNAAVPNKRGQRPVSAASDDDDDDDNKNDKNDKKKNKKAPNKKNNKKNKGAEKKDDDDTSSDDDSDDEEEVPRRRNIMEQQRNNGRKRSRSEGPFSPGAEYRLFKMFSLAMSVFLFITAVICFQWNCLFAHMCFVTEDPAVPQPQSNFIVPILAATLVLAPVGHLLVMSETPNWMTIYGIVVLVWAVVVLVMGSICFDNANEINAPTLAQASWDSSPFPTEVIQRYYVDVTALKVKMQFNLNSLGGCALAVSIFQLMHALCCLMFGVTLLRS